jgi:hypothetical protein
MIDAEKYGVSFSLKQCLAFRLDPHACLDWLIAQGWRRFRLMTYWNEHEKAPGAYDFTELDWQLDRIRKARGVVTLCLGVKQPRWPEYHWPEWALLLDPADRTEPLLAYLEKVIEHVKDRKEIVSYQLENEALLTGFGRNIQIDRRRLRKEYDLVKRLDPTRPVIMSTSNGWGIPLRKPRPEIVGFSLYTIMHSKGKYHKTIQKPWLHRLRHTLIRQPVFIHELQCEPWGPTAIWKMSPKEQATSMNQERIAANIAAAKKIGVYPIDLWGAEWWYWCSLHDHGETKRAVEESLA